MPTPGRLILSKCPALCASALPQVIHEQLGIVHGCITTIHDVTNTQTVVDAPNAKKSDLRRARQVFGQDCLRGFVAGAPGWL